MLSHRHQERLGPLEILRLDRVVPVRFFLSAAVDGGQVFGQVGGKGHPRCLLTTSTTRLRQWSQSWASTAASNRSLPSRMYSRAITGGSPWSTSKSQSISKPPLQPQCTDTPPS